MNKELEVLILRSILRTIGFIEQSDIQLLVYNMHYDQMVGVWVHAHEESGLAPLLL